MNCRNEGCERPVYVKHAQLCHACYERMRRGRERRLCSVPECGRPLASKGLCDMHYRRLRNTGQVGRKSVDELLRERVEITPDTGCWVWQQKSWRGGYGAVTIGGRKHMAHRVAYETWVGPIPEGLQIDHLCRNKMCVNPAHLEPVTQRENILRSDNMAARWARRTECEKCGGPLTELYNRRRCVPCFKEANRQRYLRRKAA